MYCSVMSICRIYSWHSRSPRAGYQTPIFSFFSTFISIYSLDSQYEYNEKYYYYTFVQKKQTINITKYLKGSQLLVFVDLLSSSLGTWVHLSIHSERCHA